jgi:hypothetical protein
MQFCFLLDFAGSRERGAGDLQHRLEDEANGRRSRRRRLQQPHDHQQGSG